MDPSMASAGMTGVTGMLQKWMEIEAKKQEELLKAKLAREQFAKEQLAAAHQQQINLAGQAGQNENSSINNLLAALARAQR